jgi:integrase
LASVRQLPTGFQGIYRDAAGKRHTKVWPTKTAARKWAQDGEASVRSGQHRDPRAGRVTLEKWHARWTAARVVEDSTRRTDRIYSRDVLDAFGSFPLDAITRMEVQGWVRHLERDGRGPQAIGKAVQLLTSLLEEAVREEKLPANPARGITLPRIVQQPDRIITFEEEPLLLAALPTDQDRRMVVVLLDTGLRYGELAGLHAHRVDMLRRELHVVETLTQSGTIKASPKSVRSRRTVPLSDRALEALAVQMEKDRPVRLHPDPANARLLVFRTGGQRPGRPMVEANWRRRAWLPAVEAAGLAQPWPTPHSCRHSALSRLVAQGVDLKTVQEFAGHESLTTTMRYLHSAPEAGEKVRSALRRMASDSLPQGVDKDGSRA